MCQQLTLHGPSGVVEGFHGAALERCSPFVREEPYVGVQHVRRGDGQRYKPARGKAAHVRQQQRAAGLSINDLHLGNLFPRAGAGACPRTPVCQPDGAATL